MSHRDDSDGVKKPPAEGETRTYGASDEMLPAGYEVIGRLGEGGMGTVFEARQLNPQRRVALKVIRGAAMDKLSVRMFQREAASLALLKHPNIGAIYETGLTEAGEHHRRQPRDVVRKRPRS